MTVKRYLARHKRLLLALLLSITAAVVYFVRKADIQHSWFVVRRVTFEKFIETKGEIQGKNSTQISLPDIFKDPDIQIWDFKIKDMTPEGTIVKKGDWVASLDQINLNQRIQTNGEALEISLAQLKDERIDTAVALSQLRQNILEQESQLEYKALDLEQAKFESPSYQRRMQTAYNQKIRLIDRMKRNYELQKMSLDKSTQREENRYNYYKRVDEKLRQALAATAITAPENGIVIYARTRWNRKIRVGEEVGPSRPVIATLPDLSVLISETYIEEIDIAKISLNDSVSITIDALPGKLLTGRVTTIANIGQELKGYDSKVFFVTIEIDRNKEKLMPGMTSNNHITFELIPGQLTIPRKCLFSENGKSFVYLRKEGKIWKRVVETGHENDEMVVVVKGLEEKERILLEPPEDKEEIKYSALKD